MLDTGGRERAALRRGRRGGGDPRGRRGRDLRLLDGSDRAANRAPLRRHHLAADGRAELGAHRAAEPGAVAAAEPGAVVATVARAIDLACADDARVRVRPRGVLPDDARQAGRRPHVGIPRQGMEARSTSHTE